MSFLIAILSKDKELQYRVERHPSTRSDSCASRIRLCYVKFRIEKVKLCKICLRVRAVQTVYGERKILYISSEISEFPRCFSITRYPSARHFLPCQ